MKFYFLFFTFLLSACVNDFPEETNKHTGESQNIMISSQGIHSTQAGLDIYKKSQNIVDAFVATSFAIAVERPQSTGIGGGGFAIIKFSDSKVRAFDFRESAPGKTHKKIFLDESGEVIKSKSRVGSFAIGTPGLVMGLYKIHKKFGKLPWAELVQPAIKIAREGVKVYPHMHSAMKGRQKYLKRFPSSSKIYLKEDGSPYEIGENLIQEDLAKTLELIAKNGPDAFYKGEIAKKIVATIKKYNGPLSLEDLAKYKVYERDPIKGSAFGYQIYSMPPPSSGGLHVLQILKLMEGDKQIKYNGFNDYYLLQLTRAMGFAFHDRAKYLGDPDFNKVSTQKLLSSEHLAPFYKTVKKGTTSISELPSESNDTTHFTIMDSKGNVISSTQTVNYHFGSALVAEGTGIVLNNEMDDFSAKANSQNTWGDMGGDLNLAEPYKRPLSSMSPTIVFKNKMPYLALGTADGARIITCVAQVLLNHLALKKDIKTSVDMPRIHYQVNPDILRYEKMGNRQIEYFKTIGFKPELRKSGCKIQAITLSKGLLQGVSDPRGVGASIGF